MKRTGDEQASYLCSLNWKKENIALQYNVSCLKATKKYFQENALYLDDDLPFHGLPESFDNKCSEKVEFIKIMY